MKGQKKWKGRRELKRGEKGREKASEQMGKRERERWQRGDMNDESRLVETGQSIIALQT